ncbi:MAG: Gldg family protein [Rhodospirillaceae bacterium]
MTPTPISRRMLSLAALGVAAVLFLAVNVLSQTALRQARLDLTADRLFTLSEGTRSILAGLREPITLKLFFSDKLAGAAPQVRLYGQRVREVLEEYVNRSKGKIRLQVIDPEPFSDAEDRAVQAGIQGVPIDQGSGQPAYFGLLGTNTTDHHEVIPFFSQTREPFLEYDLTRLVYALTEPPKPVVGVVTSMDLTYGPGGTMAAMRGGGGQTYAFLRLLRQSFDIRVLKPDIASIDKDVSVLLVLRPQKLAEPVLFAIDQYVLAGGKAVVYVDPYVESLMDQPGPTGMPVPAQRGSGLGPLFAAWGIGMDEGRFVADPGVAVQVSAGQGAKRRAVPYPAWLTLGPDNLSRDDVVTADLTSLMLASAGALVKRAAADITFTPLLTGSRRGQLLEVSTLEGEPDPEALMAALNAGGEARVLAARITGTVHTAFPDRHLDQGTPLTVSAKPANLIVVADTDLLEDRFWVQEQDLYGQRVLTPFAGNIDFLANAIDNLAGSSDLIGLRGRAGATRPFLVVEGLQRAAGEQFLAREKALRTRLSQIEKQIADLEGKAKPGSGTLLAPEEQGAIDRYRSEILRTRKELREVQHNLNRDIERLSASLKAVNIAVVPVLVAGFALGLAGWRARRRRLTVRE